MHINTIVDFKSSLEFVFYVWFIFLNKALNWINNTHICLNKHLKWKGDNLYNEQQIFFNRHVSLDALLLTVFFMCYIFLFFYKALWYL
jgi:hypothetical protein